MRRPFMSIGFLLLTAFPVFAASLLEISPPGKHFPLNAAAHRGAPSFQSGQPIIGTTYFYWYDVYTGAHLRDPDGTDALTTHPPLESMADLSYKSPRWHYSQLQDVAQAGIDFILPVYWGVPGQYKEGQFAWSVVGLPPLVAAHDRMAQEHAQDPSRPAPPQIGLFYDTSTLRWNSFDGPNKNRQIDLTTPEGREWFYVTIRDFFSLIPPAKWARIDGRPIIFLYAGEFARKIDDKLFDDARRRFQADFGTDFFLVRHSDWPGRADAWYQWGGALNLTIGDVVAGLGPGYDHSAVPNRTPLVVDRQGGRFYDQQWEKLLRMNPRRRPWIIHLETWNEWHEGTDIARSRNWGDQYIQATARYARQFKQGIRLEPKGEFVNASRVRWSGGAVAGLTLLPPAGDGCWEQVEVDGAPAIVSTLCAGAAARYLYFDVDDAYMYDEMDRAAELTVVFREDDGCESFTIEYDNEDPTAGPVGGAFRAGPTFKVGQTGVWRTVTVQLPHVRFANRANRADFRLAIHGGQGRLTVREVMVRRLRGEIVK